MAKKVKVELDTMGVRSMLQSSEMLAEMERHANRALSALGEGYEVTTLSPGKTRVNAQIAANTPKTYYSNRKHNHILKAVRSLHD